MEKKNELLQLSFEFALAIIEFSEQLEKQTKTVMASKLLKSGTSIGVYIKQAHNTTNDKDYISKLNDATKTAIETEYWLHLCICSPAYNYDNSLMTKLIDLKKLLNRVIADMKYCKV